MGRYKLLRIDAAWNNECFLAEAETAAPDGETVYAAVTDCGGVRTYRLLKNSAYDDAFCRVERIGITEKDDPVLPGSSYGAGRIAGSLSDPGCPGQCGG